MIKACLSGAAAAAFLAGSAAAAASDAPAWVITPQDEACQTDLELTGASGATVQGSLVSDGEHLALRFPREEAPQQAFLPIRIDHRPYANLVLRTEGADAEMQLSAETQAALRKGQTLQIGWLGPEPVSASLSGSEQALSDLRTCGAQVAGRHREQLAAERDAKARSEAEARAKALSDEQLAAAKAQRQAAESASRRDEAEAERLRAAAESDRQRAQQAEAAGYPQSGYGAYAAPDPRYPAPEPSYPAYAPYPRW